MKGSRARRRVAASGRGRSLRRIRRNYRRKPGQFGSPTPAGRIEHHQRDFARRVATLKVRNSLMVSKALR